MARIRSRRQRERVAPGVPHPSWGIDRPLFSFPRPPQEDAAANQARTVTPDEIWALVDAQS